MKKLTKESIENWLKCESWTLHETVCLAFGIEPAGERPANPSARYLEVERWVVENVPQMPLMSEEMVIRDRALQAIKAAGDMVTDETLQRIAQDCALPLDVVRDIAARHAAIFGNKDGRFH